MKNKLISFFKNFFKSEKKQKAKEKELIKPQSNNASINRKEFEKELIEIAKEVRKIKNLNCKQQALNQKQQSLIEQQQIINKEPQVINQQQQNINVETEHTINNIQTKLIKLSSIPWDNTSKQENLAMLQLLKNELSEAMIQSNTGDVLINHKLIEK